MSGLARPERTKSYWAAVQMQLAPCPQAVGSLPRPNNVGRAHVCSSQDRPRFMTATNSTTPSPALIRSSAPHFNPSRINRYFSSSTLSTPTGISDLHYCKYQLEPRNSFCRRPFTQFDSCNRPVGALIPLFQSRSLPFWRLLQKPRFLYYPETSPASFRHSGLTRSFARATPYKGSRSSPGPFTLVLRFRS